MTLLKIGPIGSDRFGDIYMKNCAAFEGLESTACASLDIEEPRTKAAQHGAHSVHAAIAPDTEGSRRVDD